MATTFNEVATACGSSQTCFVNNSDVLSWANTESYMSKVPIDLILAQWIAEGAWTANSSSAACNDPGNSQPGTYSGCGPTTSTAGSCPAYSLNYYVSDALTGVETQANIILAKYCAIPSAFQESSLTTGGAELYDFASSRGYTMLSNGTYNAAYAWGSSPWAGSHYEEIHWVKNGSTIPGSALILFIEQDNLYGYDYIGSSSGGPSPTA